MGRPGLTAGAVVVGAGCVTGWRLMGSMRAAPLLCVTLLTLLLDAVYAGAGVRLLVVGDWGRQGSSDQRKVADAMGREAASAPLYAVLSTGGALLEIPFDIVSHAAAPPADGCVDDHGGVGTCRQLLRERFVQPKRRRLLLQLPERAWFPPISHPPPGVHPRTSMGG